MFRLLSSGGKKRQSCLKHATKAQSKSLF